MIKVTTWNVNGLRAALRKASESFVASFVTGAQEGKIECMAGPGSPSYQR